MWRFLPFPMNRSGDAAAEVSLDLRHMIHGHPLHGPFAPALEQATFALGCFWGAERIFWQLNGVHITAVGYSGGHTADPTYRAICRGDTGHAEAVRVVYHPGRVDYGELLRVFWESHDPTQGMRQGNDHGTQYRSAIYTHDDEQMRLATESRAVYQGRLQSAGRGAITTEITAAAAFHYAEDYHQQYLVKNPGGYCGIGGTGVCYAA